MSDEKEIADLILYNGPVEELNAFLEREGVDHRYEVVGPRIELTLFRRIDRRGLPPSVDASGGRYTPLRRIKNNAIPVINPTFGS